MWVVTYKDDTVLFESCHRQWKDISKDEIHSVKIMNSKVSKELAGYTDYSYGKVFNSFSNGGMFLVGEEISATKPNGKKITITIYKNGQTVTNED